MAMTRLRESCYRGRRFLRESIAEGVGWARQMARFRRRYMTRDPAEVERIYGDDSLPAYVEIEVTTHCNLKCRICEHTYWDEKPRHMPFESFRSIVDQFPRLDWIGLTGIGESLLHPDFRQMVELVKSRGAFLELYDTFYFIDESMAGFLIDAQCDTLIISLDAATAATYDQVRAGSDFQRVTGNLRKMFELQRSRGGRKPELLFHFIVNSLNKHEMVPFVDLAHEISGGDTRVIFTRMLHTFPEIEDLFCEIEPGEREAVVTRGKELGMPVSWNADAASHKPPCSMCSAWLMPFIFVTGDVIPCCSGNEANARERQRQTAMGNVFDQSLAEIWRGEKYRELRRSLYDGRRPPSCENCCLYEEGTHRA